MGGEEKHVLCFWISKRNMTVCGIISTVGSFCCITQIAVHNTPLELRGPFQLRCICAGYSNPGVFGFTQPCYYSVSIPPSDVQDTLSIT